MAKIKYDIEKISDPISIWDDREAWLSLLDSTTDRMIFLTPHWVFLSYDYFGVKGEFEFYKVKENQNIKGFIPLSIESERECATTVNAELERALTDIVADPGVKVFIFNNLLNKFKHVVFPRILETSSTLWAMEQSANKANANFQKEIVGQISYIEIDENLEKTIYREKGKKRDRVLKLMKKIPREVNGNIQVVQEKSRINNALDGVFSLTNKESLSVGEEAFLRDVTALFSRSDWARIYTFFADGWPVAGALVFSYDSSSFVYLLSENKEASSIKPGTYLFYNILKQESLLGKKRVFFHKNGFDPILSTKTLNVKKASLTRM